MKEGLIRLTNEKDIFYDSIDRVYRYRMHCPQCGKVIKSCQCYQDLEELYNDIDEGVADNLCSAKCSLLYGDWDHLEDAMIIAEVKPRKIEKLNKKEARKVLTVLTENYDYCFDYPHGKDCKL